MGNKKAETIKDNYIFDYKLKQDKSNSPAVLCTLEGYATFADDESNANGHFYPGNFWRNVLLDNQEIKDKLETKTFFGSARHPNPDEPPTPEFDNISHNIRNFQITDEGHVWVVLDILNTDTGRVIKTLVDYGSKIGISTRAFGEVKEDDKGRLIPVLDNYYFVTWDLVTYPAFGKKATLDQVKHDSININEKDLNIKDVKGFVNKINSIHDTSEVKMICDYTGIQYSQDDMKSDTEKALEEAMDRILKLEEQVKKASNQSINDKGSNNINNCEGDTGKRNSRFVKDNISNIDFNKKSIKRRSDNKGFSISDEQLKKYYLESKLKKDLDSVKNQLDEVKTEKQNIENQLNDYKKDLNTVRRNKNNFVDSYKKKINIYYNKVKELNDKISEYESQISDYKNSIQKLNDKIDKFKQVIDTNKQLKEEVELLKDDYYKLEDSYNKLQDEKKSLVDNNNKLYKINSKLRKDIENQVSINDSSNDKSIKIKTTQPMFAANKIDNPDDEELNDDKDKNRFQTYNEVDSLNNTLQRLNSKKK